MTTKGQGSQLATPTPKNIASNRELDAAQLRDDISARLEKMQGAITQAANTVRDTVANNIQFDAYGQIAWLWATSDLHREWPQSSLAHFALPAITNKQYLVVEHRGLPVAYCSWAFMDKETEAKYILDPNSLSPDKWQSGDRLWFVDWISPFNKRFTWVLRRALMKRFPDKVARSYHVRTGKGPARISTFVGPDLDKEQSHAIRRTYFQEVVEMLKNSDGLGDDFELKFNQ